VRFFYRYGGEIGRVASILVFHLGFDPETVSRMTISQIAHWADQYNEVRKGSGK
jgi:hypothetical protein